MQLGNRASKKYSDPNAWHNQFYNLVTTKIDEEIFRRTGNFPWIAPAPLTKYLSTTEHEERQVTDSMHLCPQPLYL